MGKKERIQLAINSILRQTYKNFEFLIINDGSNKEISQFLERISLSDDRIRLVQNEGNKGLIYSLNRGISLSQTNWIVRMDADDYSLPNRIRVQMKYLSRHPDVKVLGTGYKDLKSNRILQSKYLSRSQLLSLALWNNPLCHPSVVMHKKVIELANGYPDKKYVRDYALWTTLLYKYHINIEVIPDILFAYRTVDGKHKYGVLQEQNHLQVVKSSLSTLQSLENMRSSIFAGWEKFRISDAADFQKKCNRIKKLQSYVLPAEWDKEIWQQQCQKRLKRLVRGYNGPNAFWIKLSYFVLRKI